MLRFEPFQGTLEAWGRILETIPDRHVFQTPAWIRYIAESQRAEPVIAVLRDGSDAVGYFAGLTVRKAGLRILGSPFVGWGTEYMGIRLIAEVPRRLAVEALLRYAFETLGCVHVEVGDAAMVPADVSGLGFESRVATTYLVDLTQDEDRLLHSFAAKSCRYSIRKAAKLGVVVEEARDAQFAEEYFAQLEDVFAKQSLVPTYRLDRVRLLVKHLLPTGNLLLLRARDPEGRCIATGVFLGMNECAYFWGNASWRQDQHLCPNESIHWHAMRYWKSRGCRVYDFCGGGDYKRKYAGTPCERYCFLKSKYAWVSIARRVAYRSFLLKQRLMGLVERRH